MPAEALGADSCAPVTSKAAVVVAVSVAVLERKSSLAHFRRIQATLTTISSFIFFSSSLKNTSLLWHLFCVLWLCCVCVDERRV